MAPRTPDWQEDTRDHRGKMPPKPIDSDPPVSLDNARQVGVLMAALAKNDRALTDTKQALDTLTREVGQLRRDIEKDREALVKGASTRAANHSSNRLAVLMGGLFTLWEVASPYVHELVRILQVHQ